MKGHPKSKSEANLFQSTTPAASLAESTLLLILGSAYSISPMPCDNALDDSLRPRTSLSRTTVMSNETSILMDLERVLLVKESEYKSVRFDPSPPSKMTYDVDSPCPLTLQIPKRTYPLFMDSQERVLSPLDRIQRSVLLQMTMSSVETEAYGVDDSVNDDAKEDSVGMEVQPSLQQKLDLIGLFVMDSDHNKVCFDRISMTKSSQKVMLLDPEGLTSGRHEWSIQILRTDVDLQEIGVIGTNDIARIAVSNEGAHQTAGFKSRVVYGCEMSSGLLFYGSWEANGKKRCHRDLRPYFNVGWRVGDVITVRLDLSLCKIKFLLNGKSVRFTMSVQPKQAYFPMICFSGDCQYALR